MTITIIKNPKGGYTALNEAGENVGTYKRISDISRQYRHEIERGFIKLQKEAAE